MLPQARAHAAAVFIPLLDGVALVFPMFPMKPEMENVLLYLRKRALIEDYLGNYTPHQLAMCTIFAS